MIEIQPMVDPNGLYSLKKAREALGISTSSMYRSINMGILNVYHHPAFRRPLVKGSDIIAFWKGDEGTFLRPIAERLKHIQNVIVSCNKGSDIRTMDQRRIIQFFKCYNNTNDIIAKAEEIAHIDMNGLYDDAKYLSEVCDKFENVDYKVWESVKMPDNFEIWEHQILVNKISAIAKAIIFDIEDYRKKNAQTNN